MNEWWTIGIVAGLVVLVVGLIAVARAKRDRAAGLRPAGASKLPSPPDREKDPQDRRGG